MLVIVGSQLQLKLKTTPQKLMLTTFPFVTDSFFFYPLSVHDMQLKTKQKIIPPNKTDVKVASSHIIVVFPSRLWLTLPGNNQNYVGSLSIKPYKRQLVLPFCFGEWRVLFWKQLSKCFATHTPPTVSVKLLYTQVHVWAQQAESQHHSGLQ